MIEAVELTIDDEFLDRIVECDTTGFWLTDLINGEKYFNRPCTELEVSVWKRRDRERAQIAEEERARLAQEAYDTQQCGECGIARNSHTDLTHAFNEEPWVAPEVLEGVLGSLGVDEPKPLREDQQGAVYDRSAEGDEPRASE